MLVRLDGEPGTSNPRMTQIATGVSRELRSIPGVDNVGAHVGRAVTGDQVVDVNSGELWVSVDAGRRLRRDRGRRSRTRWTATRGASTATSSRYSAQRIRDVGALNDGDNPVAGRRPRRADRVATSRSSCASTARTSHAQRREAQQGAAARVPGRRRRRSARRAAGRAADHRDRDGPRQGAALRRQARRRAPRGGARCSRASRSAASSRSRRCST